MQGEPTTSSQDSSPSDICHKAIANTNKDVILTIFPVPPKISAENNNHFQKMKLSTFALYREKSHDLSYVHQQQQY